MANTVVRGQIEEARAYSERDVPGMTVGVDVSSAVWRSLGSMVRVEGQPGQEQAAGHDPRSVPASVLHGQAHHRSKLLGMRGAAR